MFRFRFNWKLTNFKIFWNIFFIRMWDEFDTLLLLTSPHRTDLREPEARKFTRPNSQALPFIGKCDLKRRIKSNFSTVLFGVPGGWFMWPKNQNKMYKPYSRTTALVISMVGIIFDVEFFFLIFRQTDILFTLT